MKVKPQFKKIEKIGDEDTRIEKEKKEKIEKRYVDIDTMNDALKRTSEETIKAVVEVVDKRQIERNGRSGGEGETFVGLDPKIERQLEGTVKLFNTLKEFSSNPLQKAIETKVGELAAGVVENAFGKPAPKPKGLLGEIASTFLDTQFGAQLGANLGQRSPELVESLGKTFGKDKAANMIDGILGTYGKTRQLGSGSPDSLTSGPSQPGQLSGGAKPTEKELILNLDPNNPEHISAYADSQGGLPVETARKMLMIHQDTFIEEMKNTGLDVSKFINKERTEGQIRQQQTTEQSQQQIIEQQTIKQLQQQTTEQSQQQIIKMLNQFSGNVNKALGNTNTIINGLYKKIGELENEINILKGVKEDTEEKDTKEKDIENGKEIVDEESGKEIVDEESGKEIVEEESGKEITEGGEVNNSDSQWSDNARYAEFMMRT